MLDCLLVCLEKTGKKAAIIRNKRKIRLQKAGVSGIMDNG